MKRTCAAALAALTLSALVTVSASAEESQTAAEPAKPPETATRMPELVVTADRMEVRREDVGRSIDSRTSEDFKEQESSSLVDSLQTIPGVRSQNLGGPGSPGTSLVEIRGFRSSGTQLLLNGLRLNDPSSISGIADTFFAFLTTNDLRGVEVLRGGNGTLYGSDGQAGSVNMLTEMPKAGVNSKLLFRGGSYSTFEESAQISAGGEDGGMITTVTRIDSEGLNHDRNYENTTVSSVGEYKLSEEIKLTPIFRMVVAKNSLDANPALSSDGKLVTNLPSENNHSTAQAFHYGLTTEYHPAEEFTSKLSIYANNTIRSYYFEFDGFGSDSDFKGNSFNIDWQNSLAIPELASTLIAGAEYEHQDYRTITGNPDDDEGTQDRYAVFVKNRVSLLDRMLELNAGARLTHISAIDRTLPIFEASGVFKCPVVGTRVHSSVSQGFRAPSLFETQGKLVNFTTGVVDTVGNRSLKPEESLSFDAGVTQPLFDKRLEADVTFFNLASDNTILFDFSKPAYLNGGGGETQGLEYSIAALPVDWLNLRAAYTYLGKADVGGERLQRRPHNVFAIASTVNLGFANWYTELRYRDSQRIEFFGAEDTFKEDPFTILNTAITVPVSNSVELFVRGDNLFDTQYTDAGYRMPGISFFGGIRLKLGA